MRNPAARPTPTPLRKSFAASYRFPFDDFQIRALDAMDAGRSVVVAAPTGSGKTVVAEYAVAKAIDEGGKCFYTTPIKALSNQKYNDLVARHGSATVGLLTGDNSVNERAPVIVMTTEVLRNMLYLRSPALEGLRYVVLDEVHYLQDAYRGPVWEEVIIHAPPEVDLVCLSATVSNATELADWVSSVRGATEAVIHTERPVELIQLYLVADRESGEITMFPTFVDGRPNPDAAKIDERSHNAPAWPVRGRVRRGVTAPRRLEVIETLLEHELLPALYFIFSRAACDDAVTGCLASGVRLTRPAERTEIRDIVEEHVRSLSDDDLHVLRYDRFMAALEAGFAAHHAGMVPPFKEAVEACFVRGLVKAVFATETLALGINMPARTVVIEKLSKFGGERHDFLTAGEYTQLTGRAGRRGIDDVGYAAVLWNPFVTFDQVAALASRRTYELRSAFRPTYNMAVNLIRRYQRDEARHLLQRSFAQYQVEADVVRVNARIDQLRRQLREARSRAYCELGDVEEYRKAQTRDRAGSRTATVSPAVVADALDRLELGDVVDLPDGRGWAAVVSKAKRRGAEVQLRAVLRSGKVATLTHRDFRALPDTIGKIRLPAPYVPNSQVFQKATVSVLHRFAQQQRSRRRRTKTDLAEDTSPTSPVESCPELDNHLRAAALAERLSRELDRQVTASAEQTATLNDQLETVLAVLEEQGYVAGWSITPAGVLLAGIFHDLDLAVAQVLRAGVLDGLSAPQLAGLVSGFIYERRGPGATRGRDSSARRSAGARDVLPRTFPSALTARWEWMLDVVADLNQIEERYGVPGSRVPDPGFVAVAQAWASGKDLDTVLVGEEELTGGDFVRTVKTLIDLLRQIGQVAPVLDTAAAARRAAADLLRGVVAASSVGAPQSAAGPEGAGLEGAGPGTTRGR